MRTLTVVLLELLFVLSALFAATLSSPQGFAGANARAGAAPSRRVRR